MEEEQRKCSVSSDDSDTTDSHATSWSRCSKIPTTKTTCTRQKEKKPSEVFRTDLITAMKVPDSHQFGPDDFYILADPWRQDWEKGVQVPANIDAVPQPQVRLLEELEDYYSQTANNSSPDSECPGGTQQATCRYDLDEVDTCWLELVNKEFKKMDMPHLEELTLEKVLEELELLCHENMNLAIEKEEGLGIEYDEDVVCDVCRSPEGEDGNEMVFCDKCNVCVHQGPTPAAISEITEKRHLNVAHGLAWSYYVGYLKFVLPALKDSVKRFNKENNLLKSSDTCSLHILIPLSCRIYGDLKEIDGNIEFVKAIPPLYIDRAGIKGRVFKNNVYRILDEDHRPYYCIVEYATPLASLYEMSDVTSAAFSKEDRIEQAKLFCRTLEDILENSLQCRNAFRLVIYDDCPKGEDHSEHLLSREILKHLKQQHSEEYDLGIRA